MPDKKPDTKNYVIHGEYYPKDAPRSDTAKTYSVPMFWIISATIEVDAETAEDAAIIAGDVNLDDCEVTEYLRDSFEVDEENIREIDHSVNCYFCADLKDERECLPADDYNGNDGGSICEKCSELKEPQEIDNAKV